MPVHTERRWRKSARERFSALHCFMMQITFSVSVCVAPISMICNTIVYRNSLNLCHRYLYLTFIWEEELSWVSYFGLAGLVLGFVPFPFRNCNTPLHSLLPLRISFEKSVTLMGSPLKVLWHPSLVNVTLVFVWLTLKVWL